MGSETASSEARLERGPERPRLLDVHDAIVPQHAHEQDGRGDQRHGDHRRAFPAPNTIMSR